MFRDSLELVRGECHPAPFFARCPYTATHLPRSPEDHESVSTMVALVRLTAETRKRSGRPQEPTNYRTVDSVRFPGRELVVRRRSGLNILGKPLSANISSS